MNKPALILFKPTLFVVVGVLLFNGSAFCQKNRQNTAQSQPVSRAAINNAKEAIVQLNIKDFGAKADGISNDIPAFEAAKQALQKQGGGILYFPTGKYMSDKNGWQVNASNITLQGDGIDKTCLLTPDRTNAPGIQLAPYRNAGWNNAPEQQYTYEDEGKAGDLVVKVKAGQSMDAFKPGTIFYLTAGANYYDQSYGEFNIVERVEGYKIYLKYPLCKDYSTEKSAWSGSLATDFTPPSIGGIAKAFLVKGPISKRYPYNISISNELYTVLGMQGNEYDLKNIGKGNRASVLPARTKVYIGRSIRITPSTAYNITVKNMTIEGHRKAVVLSNSVESRFANVKFIWNEGTDMKGIWLDGDDGRDCIIQDCIAQSDSIVPSQFARSFSDIKILHSIFLQASIDFTEFNANCEVANCSFTIKSASRNSRYPNSPAITTGASTFNTYVHDNTIAVYNRSSAISSQPDIQGYAKNSLHNTVIEHNTIQAIQCGSAINVIAAGNTKIEDNTITGSVSYVFGGTGAALMADSTMPENERKELMSNSVCSITNNNFKGSTDGFFTREPNNVIIEGNIIEQTNEYTKGGNAKAEQMGNIISARNANKGAFFFKFILRNNTFIGWNYTANSINFTKPITKDVDISNNRFLNNTGTFKKEKSFTISITH